LNYVRRLVARFSIRSLSVHLSAAAVLAALCFGALPAFSRGAPDSFADLAEKLGPSVVNISTSSFVARTRQDEFGADSKSLEDLLRKKRDEQDSSSNTPRRRQTSLGSGFIIDKTGYIVTNNHVVADADEISVILDDDTVLPAKLIGRDDKVDIALLKVEAGRDLPFVTWGNSSVARVGEWVMAIGNPFGLSGSVSAGIISARARDLNSGPGHYDDFIQTDAAINRGNSGGPLFNMEGQVIGVNTAIYSMTGGSVGIGFAASSNLIRPVIEDLRQYGRTRRGWIGVQIQNVTDEIANTLGLDRARGALVSQLTENGPAALSGIESSDIVLTFDGKAINKRDELPRIVAETGIDKIVDVTLWRKGQQKIVKVTVAELKDESAEEKKVATAEPPAQKPDSAVGAKPDAKQDRKQNLAKILLKDLGVTVAEITDAARQTYSIPEAVKGLVVVEVDQLSDAALKGLRAGDVIDEISQIHVASAAEAGDALNRIKGDAKKTVLLRVTSMTGIHYVPVKIS
jgi:serine protease Do